MPNRKKPKTKKPDFKKQKRKSKSKGTFFKGSTLKYHSFRASKKVLSILLQLADKRNKRIV